MCALKLYWIVIKIRHASDHGILNINLWQSLRIWQSTCRSSRSPWSQAPWRLGVQFRFGFWMWGQHNHFQDMQQTARSVCWINFKIVPIPSASTNLNFALSSLRITIIAAALPAMVATFVPFNSDNKVGIPSLEFMTFCNGPCWLHNKPMIFAENSTDSLFSFFKCKRTMSTAPASIANCKAALSGHNKHM